MGSLISLDIFRLLSKLGHLSVYGYKMDAWVWLWMFSYCWQALAVCLAMANWLFTIKMWLFAYCCLAIAVYLLLCVYA